MLEEITLILGNFELVMPMYNQGVLLSMLLHVHMLRYSLGNVARATIDPDSTQLY